jgi:hypothetical protein
VTQQNAARVEENAAAAKTVEHQSESMNQKVVFFKLDVRARRRRMPFRSSSAKICNFALKSARRKLVVNFHDAW